MPRFFWVRIVLKKEKRTFQLKVFFLKKNKNLGEFPCPKIKNMLYSNLHGEMAEWSIASDLKSDELTGSVSSNLTFSFQNTPSTKRASTSDEKGSF